MTRRYSLTLDGQPPIDLGRMSEQSARLLVALYLSRTTRRVTWGAGWHAAGLDGIEYLLIFSRADHRSQGYCGILHRKN